MKPEEAEKMFLHPVLRPVLDIAKEWFKDEERVTFHDPLTAVALFHPDVIKTERGFLRIDIESRLLAGFTYWRPDEKGPHEGAMDVNRELFFKYLFEVFSQEEST